MKCRTCEYGDKTEHEKPCILYSDNCEHYKPIEIITESERIELNEAVQIMIQITERMEREGKELVYENKEKKIRVEYNTRMVKFFKEAVYEISKGVAE